MGTKHFPGPEIWEDSIIALEHGNVYGSKLSGLHELRAFAAAGVFDKAKAVMTGPLDDDSEETLLKVICREVHRPDMVILENVDFVHRTPMTILPVGPKTGDRKNQKKNKPFKSVFLAFSLVMMALQ